MNSFKLFIEPFARADHDPARSVEIWDRDPLSMYLLHTWQDSQGHWMH